jgi:glycosyltransferase involved in cell wall biosynthesis
MGELLACGIPVVGNVGVGDMAGLITRYDVGAIVKDNSEVELAKSANELLDYLNTKHSDTNCRDAAVDYFSADQGAEKYRQIYKQAISKYRSEN